MDIQSVYQVDRTGVEGMAAAQRVTGGGTFATALAKETAGGGAKTAAEVAAEKQAEQEARKVAAGLVNYALILPMLKQLRRESWGGKGVFAPGIGEKTFGPEFDMQIADRIAQSPKMGVTASLTQRLLKRHLAMTTAK